jgi:hypothetical protein
MHILILRYSRALPQCVLRVEFQKLASNAKSTYLGENHRRFPYVSESVEYNMCV